MVRNSDININMDELMVLASYKTLKNFDSSDLKYHLHDITGMIEDISEEFKKQFNENLLIFYKEELAKHNLQL